MAASGIDDTARNERLGIPAISPQCAFCRHMTGPFKCEAFDAIPLVIWTGEVAHLRSRPGDNGIVFSPIAPMP